jgi:hypothetical protein
VGKSLRWNDARGESRTRTRLPSVDFESTASAIPPLGHGDPQVPAVRKLTRSRPAPPRHPWPFTASHR